MDKRLKIGLLVGIPAMAVCALIPAFRGIFFAVLILSLFLLLLFGLYLIFESVVLYFTKQLEKEETEKKNVDTNTRPEA